MKLLASAISAMAVILTCASANAQDRTLTCDMNDYGSAGNSPEVRKLVPPHGVHTIEGSTAQLEGTSMSGDSQGAGSRVKIRYVGQLKDIGDVAVVYTYIKPTGIMIAKTRSLRALAWEDYFPERMAEFIITGHCTSK